MLNVLFKDRNRSRRSKLPKSYRGTPVHAQNVRHIKIKQQRVLIALARYFQKVLVDLPQQLHRGGTVEEKKDFCIVTQFLQ